MLKICTSKQTKQKYLSTYQDDSNNKYNEQRLVDHVAIFEVGSDFGTVCLCSLFQHCF